MWATRAGCATAGEAPAPSTRHSPASVARWASAMALQIDDRNDERARVDPRLGRRGGAHSAADPQVEVRIRRRPESPGSACDWIERRRAGHIIDRAIPPRRRRREGDRHGAPGQGLNVDELGGERERDDHLRVLGALHLPFARARRGREHGGRHTLEYGTESQVLERRDGDRLADDLGVDPHLSRDTLRPPRTSSEHQGDEHPDTAQCPTHGIRTWTESRATELRSTTSGPRSSRSVVSLSFSQYRPAGNAPMRMA